MSFSIKLNIDILFQIVNKKCLHFDCDHRRERFHLKTHTSQSQVNVIPPLDSRPHVRDTIGAADAFVQFSTIPWASYQIRKIAGCACAGNAGNVFPANDLKRKPLVSNPGMHHGTCVTHVP